MGTHWVVQRFGIKQSECFIAPLLLNAFKILLTVIR
jgi:hypothetical protein